MDHVEMVLNHEAGIFQHERIRNNCGNNSALLLLGRGSLNKNAGLPVYQKVLARFDSKIWEMRAPSCLEVEFSVSIYRLRPDDWKAFRAAGLTKLVFVAVPNQLAGCNAESVIRLSVGQCSPLFV